MCGLFGIISSVLSPEEKKIAVHLGILNSFRGTDSTGVCLGSGNEHMLIKAPIDSFNFFHSKEAFDAIKGSVLHTIIGHTRHATVGAVNQANAHPHKVGNTVVTHNGMVDKFVPKKNDDDLSDSYFLTEYINDFGLDETLSELTEYEGAYALVVWDAETRKLRFVRNSKRPLWLMSNRSNSTIAWASEKGMLDFVKSHCNLTFFDNPVELPVGEIWTIEDSSKPQSYQHMTKHKVEYKKYTPPTTTGGFRSRFFEDWDYDPKYNSYHKKGASSSTGTSTTETTAQRKAREALTQLSNKGSGTSPKAKKHGNVDLKGPHYRGFEGIFFPVDFIERQLGNCCIGCGARKKISDKIFWATRTDYVCEDCNNGTWFHEMNGHRAVFMGKFIPSLDETTTTSVPVIQPLALPPPPPDSSVPLSEEQKAQMEEMTQQQMELWKHSALTFNSPTEGSC